MPIAAGNGTWEFLYGVNPALEALRAGRRRFGQAFLTPSPAGNRRLRHLVRMLEAQDVPIVRAEKGRLQQLAKAREHQGIVLQASPFTFTPADELLSEQRLVLPDNIEDPHNLGAIIRSAEVLGFDGVLLPTRGCPGILPSVAKSSAGACEHMRIAKDCSTTRYVQQADKRGFVVVALDAKAPLALRNLALPADASVLLVVGGENRGVGQFVLNTATHVVSIAQHGRVSSLNASVAAGIALHSLQRRT